ncbi:MAG: signal recognition particle-docking protein FtsY, partial [Sedimentitalea sp.]|nr:signal recognition particle-docking protein FtsY [Sedimentitalea sp.]
MAFFSKLKDRLFKSSSKLEEGLDAIVEAGGEIDPPRAAPDPEIPAPEPEPEPAPETPPTEPEPMPAPPEPSPTPEPEP